MTRTVAINEAILQRGVSGSARAASLIREAVERLDGITVSGVAPTRVRGRSKVLNAVGDLWWDVRGAAAAARGADTLISPCNIGRASRGQRHVLLVCDVMLWESGELFDPAFARYGRTFIPWSIRRADVTWTLSEHARRRLNELVPTADIRVLRLPAAPASSDPTRWGPGRRTVVMLGETARHKNHLGGIEAVASLRARSGEDIVLRLIGPPGNAEVDVVRRLAEVDPERRWSSREVGATDTEVGLALETAWALLQPSLNEGYGLPLIEAANRGLPVVHSGAGAMGEVLPDSSAGSSDPDDLAVRLVQLLDDRAWMESAGRGRDRVGELSWSAFCAEVAEVLAMVAQ